ncbi:hypothetical protein OUZ56_013924 [Daphnia magna]|uniref:Uncharacterized protein n=1 Tax=Daphnia magna TaxID=35525 RepID=A0ABQ9Z7C7_9CRUS|nr:hypothetical protein OUZ56_013924 [Daphnia magna]
MSNLRLTKTFVTSLHVPNSSLAQYLTGYTVGLRQPIWNNNCGVDERKTENAAANRTLVCWKRTLPGDWIKFYLQEKLSSTKKNHEDEQSNNKKTISLTKDISL